MTNAPQNLKQIIEDLVQKTARSEFNKLFVVIGKDQIYRDFFVRFLKNQMTLTLSEDVQISNLTEKDLFESGIQLASPSLFEVIKIVNVEASTKKISKKKSKAHTKNDQGGSVLERIIIRHPLVLNFQESFEFSELGLSLNADSYRMLYCDAPLSRFDLLEIIGFVGHQCGTKLSQVAKDRILSCVKGNLANLYELVEKWTLIQASNLNEDLKVELFDQLSSQTSRSHVFDLFDLLRKKRMTDAQLLLDKLIAQGEEEVFLLGVLFKFAKDRALTSYPSNDFFVRLSETDMRLKSSRIDSRALLTDLMEVLR